MDVGRLEFVLAPAFLTDTFSGSSSLSCQRIDGILDRRPDVLVKALYGASIYVHTRSLLVYERGCQGTKVLPRYVLSSCDAITTGDAILADYLRCHAVSQSPHVVVFLPHPRVIM